MESVSPTALKTLENDNQPEGVVEDWNVGSLIHILEKEDLHPGGSTKIFFLCTLSLDHIPT